MSILTTALPMLGKITEVKKALNGILATRAYLEKRGVMREQVDLLLERAEAEGRDITQAEVAEIIGEAQQAIDEMRTAAEARMPAAEPSLETEEPQDLPDPVS